MTVSEAPVATRSSAAPVRRGRGTFRSRVLVPYAMLAPGIILFVAFMAAPILYTLFLSFQKTKVSGLGLGSGARTTVFAGIDNYITTLTNTEFGASVGRVLMYGFILIPLMLGLALLFALLLDSKRTRASGFSRTAIFLPYAVPAVVAVLMWGYIYGDQFGLTSNLNDFLGSDLITPFAREWILISIGNIVTWQFVGYNMLIFYSSLKTIPTDMYEAASLDGAGAWRTIFSIKIPNVRGALVIATIFSIIGSFQLFNEPNILRPLAPNVITTYFTPNMYAYNLSFAGQQFNYAATIAIIMGVITAVIAYVVQLRGSKSEVR